eukprot:3263947-Alexandrium_andersonii.AAC.1
MCIRDRRTPWELRKPILTPSLGPRGSSSERPRRCCMFRMADCGLRRIAALTGLEPIAECTFGPLQCKDPRIC